MTRLRKDCLIMAVLIMIANLALLGIPAQSRLLEQYGGLQGLLIGLWAIGLIAILAPWIVARARRHAVPILASATGLAYGIAVVGAHLCTSSFCAAFASAGPIVEVIFITWSLAGALAFGMAAVWRPRGVTYRDLEPAEVASQVRPFAPDPALTAVFALDRAHERRAAE